MADPTAARWVVLDRSPRRMRLYVGGTSAVLLVIPVLQVPNLLRVFGLDLSPGAHIAVSAGTAALLLAILWIVVAVAHPVPAVDLARRRVRVGRREFGFDDITRATVATTGLHLRADNTGIILSAGPARRALVLLRAGERRVQDDAGTERLVAVIEGSNIEMPVDQYDPTGKMAHVNFPGVLSKERAIEFVRAAPTAKELPPWVGSR